VTDDHATFAKQADYSFIDERRMPPVIRRELQERVGEGREDCNQGCEDHERSEMP